MNLCEDRGLLFSIELYRTSMRVWLHGTPFHGIARRYCFERIAPLGMATELHVMPDSLDFFPSSTMHQRAMTARIIFVYNADSGLINGIKDYFHKIIKPDTYDCRLCFVTFGNLGMRKEWGDYIRKLPVPVEFLHRDEFFTRYPSMKLDFPAALVESAGKLELLISAEEMNAVTGLDQLIELTSAKIGQVGA